MSDDYDFGNDISLDPTDAATVRSSQKDWYKAEKGRVDRVAFVYFYKVDEIAVHRALNEGKQLSKEDRKKLGTAALQAHAEKLSKPIDQIADHQRLSLNDVRFKRFKIHFVEQNGIGSIESRLGLDGVEADEVWKRCGEFREYFTTLLLVYPTTREGELIKERLKDGWSLKPWKFSSDRMRQIIKRNKSLAENGILIASQDVEISCKDTQYQNVELNPVGPATYRKNEKLQEMVLSRAVEMYGRLSPAKELSTADLRVKLGLAERGHGSVSTTDDFSNILENV